MTFDTDPLYACRFPLEEMRHRRCGCPDGDGILGTMGVECDGYLIVECQACKSTWAWVIE